MWNVYDRSSDPAGQVRRIHQEDFCQALAINPERKYAGEGGPTFSICFGLLRQVCVRPAVEVLKLLDAVIFNLLVGNADAHGKNFSVLYDDGGSRLAPLYDLLATVAYPELSPNLAMKIGGAATLGDMDSKAWATFAGDATLGLPLVRRRVTEISEAVREQANKVARTLIQPGLDEEILSRIAELVVERAERCPRTVRA